MAAPSSYPLQSSVTGAEIVKNEVNPTGGYFTTAQIADYVNGGGGRGGTVASLAALAALDPSTGQAVTLTQSGLYGPFVWFSGNFSTQVANDPGQGIYVAPNSDTTGASGAWVRQYVGKWQMSWFGAVRDGVVTYPAVYGSPTIVSAGSVAANSAALANWGTLARYMSSLGVAVYVECAALPSDTGNAFCFDHSLCQYFACGIAILRWFDNGLLWQNIYSGAPNFNFQRPWSRLALPIENASGQFLSYPINQTVANGTTFSFTLTTPGNAQFFIPGQWVKPASLDVQYQGFPPNAQQQESTLIQAANVSTGVVTIAQPIRYQHMTTYPNYAYAGYPVCGAAQAWIMDTGPWTINGITYPYLTWGIDHEWHDLNIGCPLGVPGIVAYWTISGLSIKTFGYRGPGFSESVTDKVYHENALELYPGEPDKMNTEITRINCEFRGPIGNNSLNELTYASPVDRVTIIGGKTTQVFSPAAAKQLKVVNHEIGLFNPASAYGLSYSATFEECPIVAVGAPGLAVTNGAVTLTIDGTNVSWSNGTLVLLKSAFPTGVQTWNSVPGGWLNLPFSAGFSGVPGNGKILDLREDGSNFYIDTDLPATLPTWVTSPPTITVFRCGEWKFPRCTGCDQIRQAAAAHEARRPYWEYKEIPFAGAYSSSLSFTTGWAGEIEKIEVEIESAGSASNATMSIVFSSYDYSNSYTRDTGGIQIIIVVGIQVNGLPVNRVITQGAFAGFQSGDAVKVGGTTVSTLPQTRVIGTSVAITFSNLPANNYGNPEFVLKAYLKCGSVRKIISQGQDSAGNPTVNTQGLLP